MPKGLSLEERVGLEDGRMAPKSSERSRGVDRKGRKTSIRTFKSTKNLAVLSILETYNEFGFQERRERVASENRERIRRHSKLGQEAEQAEDKAEQAERKRIGRKDEKVELLIKEKEEERNRSRMHAVRMAKLREAVR